MTGAAVSAISDRRRRSAARRRARRRRAILRVVAVLFVCAAIYTLVAMAASYGRVKPNSDVELLPLKSEAPTVPTSQPAVKLECEPTVAPVETQKPEALVLPYTDAEVEAICKAVYGEALITHSDMEMAAVVWCILNRVDSDDPFYPEGIMAVVTQNRQFHGYDEDHPVDEHIEWLVRDVLSRWMAEKEGKTNVGRVLPAEYLFFWGDGWHNHYTTEFQGGVEYDWSLENPYDS